MPFVCRAGTAPEERCLPADGGTTLPVRIAAGRIRKLNRSRPYKTATERLTSTPLPPPFEKKSKFGIAATHIL